VYTVELTIDNNNLPLLQQLEPKIKARLIRAVQQIVQAMERDAVLSIQNQVAADGTSWTALQEWYVEWKKHKGYSEQIYIMTSTYLQAITNQVADEGSVITGTVGLMRTEGPMNKNDIPLYNIAELLEYGWEEFNVKIPPRPLWRPLNEHNKRVNQSRIGTAVYWATQDIKAMATGKPLGER